LRRLWLQVRRAVGTVIALTALSLPVFVLTIALTIAYHYLRNSRLLDLLPVTIMPAALALIIVAALKLGKDVFPVRRVNSSLPS